MKHVTRNVFIVLLFRCCCHAFLPSLVPSHRNLQRVPSSIKHQQRISLNKIDLNAYKANVSILSKKTSIGYSNLPISFPIIASDDKWGNIAILCFTASISHSIGKTTKIGKLLGPPVTAMAIAFILGSIGILPAGGSSGAKIIQLLSIQLATPLLLMSVNIRECKKSCGPLLAAFIFASFGTMLASILAYPLCASLLETALGLDGLKIAAALMAKNIGGGLNYIAVCRSLSASPNAIAAGLCVDNIFALLYFPLTSALAKGRPDPSEIDYNEKMKRDNNDIFNENQVEDIADGNINPETISAVLTIAALATWLGESIGGTSGALPLATLFTIVFTTLCPSFAKSLSRTGEALGTSLLYLFFATAGAPGCSIADSVRASFIPLGFFLSLLYGIHGLFLLMVRKSVLFWKGRKNNDDQRESNESFVSPPRLLVASSAAIGGPATAAALAKANKWESLVGPSLIVGNLGYAVSTFAALVFYSILKK
mmetsp:Transcript_10461/g.12140  ORF Transcript_10461/g.12140 Transcript_10461/m.12140 type:complete len:483 (+) Transcript_10461:214-1662(+)